MNRAGVALVLIALAAAPAPVQACDCIRFNPEGRFFARDLAAAVDHAVVIAEGTLVRPLGRLLEPALFRPSRVLKGPRQREYRIGIESDCGLMLREPEVPVGKRILLILYRNSERFEANRCVNAQGPGFERAVKARLKSMRSEPRPASPPAGSC